MIGMVKNVKELRKMDKNVEFVWIREKGIIP